MSSKKFTDLEVAFGLGKSFQLHAGNVDPVNTPSALANEAARKVRQGLIVLFLSLQGGNLHFSMPSQAELDLVAVFFVLEVNQSHPGSADGLGKGYGSSC